MDIEDITAADLQDEIIAPIIIEEYKKQVTKLMKDDKYMNIVAGYVVLCFKISKVISEQKLIWFGDDINLVLEEYSSRFITYELEPGIYTFKDISEALFNILQSDYPDHSNVIDIEYDDITMKPNWL